MNFFHDQGITIVTIQPEFQEKSMDKKGSKISLNQCLIGCQSVECAPKTCCSINDLDTIITSNAASKPQKFKKSQNQNKSNSLLSLNVTSLAKFRKMTGSAPDIVITSISESHMEQFGGSSELSGRFMPNVLHNQSRSNFENGSHEGVEPQEVNTNGQQNKFERTHVDTMEEQNLLAKQQSKSLVIRGDSNIGLENVEDDSLKNQQKP